jgi:hypothetical protein
VRTLTAVFVCRFTDDAAPAQNTSVNTLAIDLTTTY